MTAWVIAAVSLLSIWEIVRGGSAFPLVICCIYLGYSLGVLRWTYRSMPSWMGELSLLVDLASVAAFFSVLPRFEYTGEGRTRGWRSIHVTDGDHPYMGKWWVPGLQIGYEHSFVHQVADFIDGLNTGKPAGPTFKDGLATDYVTDAVLNSAKTRKWEKVRKAK